MQLPIVSPAPLVTVHAEMFADLFENQCQFRHFQNYLTGLMVLPHKSLANIARCILDSADKTNLSRFFSEAQGFQDQVNDRRLRYLLAQTTAVRQPAAESVLILDDTLCEHVGSLFLSMWIATTITARTRIRWRLTWLPVFSSAAPYVFRSICASSGAMRN